MMNDPTIYGPMVGILAMAFATYVTRVAGFWLMGHVPLTLRVRRMLETLPGAIVVATVVPLDREGRAARADRHRRDAWLRCSSGATNFSRSRSG